MSLGRFYKGRVISLVVGWFGEISKDFEQTIVTLAEEAVASDFGKTLLPLINIEKRGGLAHHVAAVQESNWSPSCERQRNAENVKTTLRERNVMLRLIPAVQK